MALALLPMVLRILTWNIQGLNEIKANLLDGQRLLTNF